MLQALASIAAPPAAKRRAQVIAERAEAPSLREIVVHRDHFRLTAEHRAFCVSVGLRRVFCAAARRNVNAPLNCAYLQCELAPGTACQGDSTAPRSGLPL
jgi:hypothetical protein